ncbi:3-dehydroshikimate dehydratase protein [Apiospora saccharicola]
MQATASTDSDHGVPANPFSAQAPASYPEPEPASTSTNPFLPQDNVPANLVQHMGSSSWAPINNTDVSTDPVHGKRSASADGQSPDNALVIDNSDDEAEAGDMEPDTNATENSSFDTEHVLQPNHPEWDNAEGDEYEDEVDAQYSDDDEPEYDDNEKGGDYDTRNYVGPNDDEDDSYDDDLRPHHLEPEFDDGDGEEWDVDEDGQFEEDDEELYCEEEEEEDAMDLDAPLQQRQPPPGTKSAPVVIDLLSSDDEDDDVPVPQPLPRTVQPATRQALPVTQLAPSSPQYSSEDAADDVEDEEDIFSDQAEDISEDGAEDDAEDEEVQLGSSDSHEQDAHMEDAQDEKVTEAEEQSPLVKPTDLVEAQEEPMALPSLEETKAVGQAGEGRATPKAVAFPVEDKVIMPDAEREIGDAQTNQPQIEPKEADFHDLTIGESSVEDTNNIATGGPQMEEDDGRYSVNLRADEESSPKNVDYQVTNAEGVKDNSDATSPKSNDHVASGASGVAFPPPPTEPNLLNQLDDKLEAAAQQNLAAVRSRASQRQLPTPLDSQLVEQPQLQESDGSQDSDSDDVMVMEIEEVVTTEVTTEERTQELASTDLSEPVFETQVPYRELFHISVPNEPSQSQFESDTQMQDSVSDFVSQETFDDDTLQAALREGNSDDLEEEEEEEGDSVEDILQAALREEEVDQEEEEDEDEEEEEYSLQAALREEEEEEGGDGSEEDALQAALREEEDEELSYSIMHTNETVEVVTSPMGEDEKWSHSITHVNETVEVVTSPLNEGSSTLPSPAQQEDSSRATNKEEQTSEKSQPYAPSWLDSVPRLEPFRPAQTPTVQRNRPQSKEQATPSIEVGDDSFTDPSVRLARASIASRRASRKREATPESSRPHTRSMCFQMSPDYKGDASVQLAKASFNVPSKSSPRDQSKALSTSPATSKSGEQLNPMPVCKAKIRRHLHDSIPDYTELKVLRHHIGKSIDVLAVALMSPPEPERAKKGPREYMMSFTVTDHSIAPSSIAEVQLYRPHKDTLPKVKSGDVVLLRNFTVLAIKNKDYGLRTNDSSSWAIFDTEDEPAQIRGPPVEYGENEMTHVDYLREWYGLLDAGSRIKLEAANKKFIEAGRNLSKQ